MEFREFEDSIVVMYEHRPDPLTYAMLGIAGESGETVDAYKKALREISPHELGNMITPGQYTSAAIPHRNKILHELGDVLWYIAKAAELLGTDLETVACMNMRKLAYRRIHGKEDDARSGRT